MCIARGCVLHGVVLQPGVKVDHKLLNLITEERISNMVLIEDGKPKKYENVENIIDSYYENMIGIYSVLKKSRIKVLKEKIPKLEDRIKIIEAVKSKMLDIHWAIDKIKDFLNSENISFDVYKTILTPEYSKDNIPKLKNDIAEIKEKLRILENSKSSDEWLNRLIKLENVIKTFRKSRKG